MQVRKGAEFVICVADSGSGDIQAWKVYQTLPDEKAAAVGCIRVIDDSGEDYVYPASQFARLDIRQPSRSDCVGPNSPTGLVANNLSRERDAGRRDRPPHR
jgi:hypothetical protein